MILGLNMFPVSATCLLCLSSVCAATVLAHGALLRRRVGWDKDDVWFAHCCMLDKSERELFADRGIGIAHCPSSNLRLASGELDPVDC